MRVLPDHARRDPRSVLDSDTLAMIDALPMPPPEVLTRLRQLLPPVPDDEDDDGGGCDAA